MCKNVVGDCIQGLLEVQVDDIHGSSLVRSCSHSIVEATRLVRHDLPLKISWKYMLIYSETFWFWKQTFYCKYCGDGAEFNLSVASDSSVAIIKKSKHVFLARTCCFLEFLATLSEEVNSRRLQWLANVNSSPLLWKKHPSLRNYFLKNDIIQDGSLKYSRALNSTQCFWSNQRQKSSQII